jgi:hypothetical protein
MVYRGPDWSIGRAELTVPVAELCNQCFRGRCRRFLLETVSADLAEKPARGESAVHYAVVGAVGDLL